MRLENQEKSIRGNSLHEYVLISTVWVYSIFCLSCHFLLSSPPVIATFFPVPILFFVFVCPFVYWGIYRGYLQGKQRERTLLVLSSLFCIFLAYATYQSGNDVTIIRLFWVFVAMAASLFLSYHYVTYLLAIAYVSMGLVHLALPSAQFDYPIWMYMVFVPMLMMCFFYIISQSILNYRRLQESERSLIYKTGQLNNILDSLNAMVLFKDKNNTYLTANQAAADFIGKDKSEIIGRSCTELFGEEAAARYYEADQKVINEGATISEFIEYVQPPTGKVQTWLKTSRVPFYNSKGEVAGIVFCAEDVTEKIIAEQKLKESEERFRMIFEKAPDGMGLIAISSYTFIKVNRAMADMLGVTEEELIGQSPTEFAHSEDRYQALTLFSEAVKSGLTEYSTEQRLLKRDGSIIICRLSAHIVREAGKPKYLICNFQDVTKKKENELRLKTYAIQLEESNQNLQEFAYAASHDLREPLRTVVSYVQLLKRYLGDDGHKPEIYEFMDFIVNGSRRMENQISALLQYSRVGRGELAKKKVDLNHSLEVVKAGLYAQIKESNAIITNGRLPEVFAEQSQVEALIQNLLSNSLKYQKKDQQPVIHVSSKKEAGQDVIIIADNGIGIEQDQVDKIFTVFSRLHTQDQYPGSGVGLAICRRIVKRHGGEIWVESEPGKGSTFYFSLPIHKEVKKLSTNSTITEMAQS